MNLAKYLCISQYNVAFSMSTTFITYAYIYWMMSELLMLHYFSSQTSDKDRWNLTIDGTFFCVCMWLCCHFTAAHHSWTKVVKIPFIFSTGYKNGPPAWNQDAQTPSKGYSNAPSYLNTPPSPALVFEHRPLTPFPCPRIWTQASYPLPLP